METIHILGYFGALALGLILGLLGSGGSLVAVPIFTYLFHISPITTTAYSLFVVGTSASIGVMRNCSKGLVDLRIALVFAIPAFITVYAVRKFLVPIIPEELFSIGQYVLTKNMAIMVFFALLMLFAAITMLRKKKLEVVENQRPLLNYPLVILEGIVVGTLTGIVGIGGGFLIIPVLVLSLKLPMKKAIATSLVIIALKSLIGFTGDLGQMEINWAFLLSFTVLSIFGILLGIYISSFVEGEKLKKSFAWLVLLMAVGIFYKELF